MKYLNTIKKKAHFDMGDMLWWMSQSDFETEIELIHREVDVEHLSLMIKGMSTLHHEGLVKFYCDDDFQIIIENHRPFYDEPGIVKEVRFLRSKVNERRVDLLLLEMERVAEMDKSKRLGNGSSSFQAEKCQLALAD